MRYIIIILAFALPGTIFSQWITLNSGTVENLRSIFFINSETGYAAGENGKMYMTVNGGNVWDTLNTGIIRDINSVYFFNESSGIACANDGIIIMTTNAGANWTGVPSGVTDNLNAISFVNERGICSGSGGTLLYTTDSGHNWLIAENGFFVTYYGTDMFSESIAYASGVNTIFQPFVAKSINGGFNWSFTNFYLNGNEGNLSDIKFISENTGFATSRVFDGQGGISRTTDGGVSWTTWLFPYQINSLDFTGTNTGYCVGNNGLILKTTDGGNSWGTQYGTSTTLRSVYFTDSITGYAVGDLGKVIKTTNGGLTAIADPEESIPVNYFLNQNYPNPFNPVTNLEFGISEIGPPQRFVSLKVYDIMGREVATLVNEIKNAGRYSAIFDGSNLAGGIYFYKIVSGEFSEVRKMIMIK